MTTTQEKEALLGLFMRKGGKTPTEAGAWLTEQGQKADSYLWWANTTLALVMKPDFDAEKNTDSEVVPTEPEIPTEPSALNPDDTIEFGEVVE